MNTDHEGAFRGGMENCENNVFNVRHGNFPNSGRTALRYQVMKRILISLFAWEDTFTCEISITEINTRDGRRCVLFSESHDFRCNDLFFNLRELWPFRSFPFSYRIKYHTCMIRGNL